MRTRGILYPVLNRKFHIPLKTRINVLNLYIIPILTYTGVAWTPLLTKTQCRQLEAALTTSIRTVIGMPKFVKNEVLRQSTDVTSIGMRIRGEAYRTFYKSALSEHQHIKNIGRAPLQQVLTKFIAPKPSLLYWANQ